MFCFKSFCGKALLLCLLVGLTSACEQKETEWTSTSAFSLSDEDANFPHMASHRELSQQEITGVGRPDYQEPEVEEEKDVYWKPEGSALAEVENLLGYSTETGYGLSEAPEGTFGFEAPVRRTHTGPIRVFKGSTRKGSGNNRLLHPEYEKKEEVRNNVMDSVAGPR